MSSRSRGLILGIAVSVAAGVVLVMTTDLQSVAAELGDVQIAWLLPCLAVLALQAWIRSARWASLLRPWAGPSIRASAVIDAMLAGYFVNAILPARLGEVARALVVSRRERIAFGGVAASVVIERAIDLMVLAALASVALGLSGSGWSVPFAALTIAIAVVIALSRRATLVARLLPKRLPARLASGIRSFLEAASAIPPAVAGAAAGLSLVAWFADTAIVLLVARSLALDIPLAGAVAIGLGGALGTALPAAPGYLATYELGAVTLAAIVGVPEATALPVAILVHVVGVTVLAAAGALMLGRVSRVVPLENLWVAARPMRKARSHGDG